MNKKITAFLMAMLSVSAFAACGNTSGQANEASEITSAAAALEASVSESEAETTETNFSTETAQSLSFSVDEIKKVMNEKPYPKIIIDENSTSDEILRAGKIAGKYFGGILANYFKFGEFRQWKRSSVNGNEYYIEIDGKTCFKCDGIYIDIDKDTYVELNYEAAKKYLTSSLFLTENGFEDLCRTSPSFYTEIDGDLYICPAEGGDAGWSYTEITDYEISGDGSSVTFNCRMVGDKDEWGYDEDLIKPFTFTLKKEYNIWKLDSCSDGMGLFSLQGLDLSPVITIDENDETVIKCREFGEKYADMYYNYGCGAAWENYIETKYFDFDDKSEDNYFEKDGIPFYKLLITDYTYDELMEYIKSFFDDETFAVFIKSMDVFIAEKNNQIYVNGNEPTFIYGMRNERAQIIGCTENDDGSVTYECYAKTTEKTDNDLYFSFTLNGEGKLCNVHEYSEFVYIGLFSTSMY